MKLKKILTSSTGFEALNFEFPTVLLQKLVIAVMGVSYLRLAVMGVSFLRLAVSRFLPPFSA